MPGPHQIRAHTRAHPRILVRNSTRTGNPRASLNPRFQSLRQDRARHTSLRLVASQPGSAADFAFLPDGGPRLGPLRRYPDSPEAVFVTVFPVARNYARRGNHSCRNTRCLGRPLNWADRAAFRGLAVSKEG